MGIKKRIVSAALAAVLMGEAVPAQAFDVADVFDGYSNTTSAGTWKSPTTGSNYMYAGSYTFKFKRGASYPPWIQVEAPSYKIGCNGISLNGGFLALIGFDDIQNQLTDAGAAFAWGILMGLVYSLPGVKEVFMTIQQWARTIQSLLQNACAIGRAMVENPAATANMMKGAYSSLTEARTDAQEKQNGQGFDAALGHLKSFAKESENIRSQIQSFADDPEGVLSNGQKKKEAVMGYVSSAIQKSLESYTGVSSSQLMGSLTQNPTWAGVEETSLSELLNTEVIGTSGILVQYDLNKKTELLLLFTFFGDIAINNSVVEGLKKFYNADGSINYDAIKNASIKGGTTIGEGATIINPVIKDSKKAAKALMEGFTADLADVCGAATASYGCFIPNYKFILYGYPKEIPSGAASVNADAGIAVSSNSAATTKKLVLTGVSSGYVAPPLIWNGFYQESLKGVIQLVEKKKTNSGTLSDIAAPLLLPNMDKYATIIKNIELQNGGNESPYTAHLKQMLARNNAYFAAMALANHVENAVAGLLKPNSMNYNAEGTKALSRFLENISERKKAILDAIRDEKKNDVDFEKLATLFQTIERENTIENLKLIRGK